MPTNKFKQELENEKKKNLCRYMMIIRFQVRPHQSPIFLKNAKNWDKKTKKTDW